MTGDHETPKKKRRQGMPHHQEELPGFETLREDTRDEPALPEDAGDELSEMTPEDEAAPPRESRALREQKERSVLRKRSIRKGDVPEADESMLGQVIENLLNNADPERGESKRKSIYEEYLQYPKEEPSADESADEEPSEESEYEEQDLPEESAGPEEEEAPEEYEQSSGSPLHKVAIAFLLFLVGTSAGTVLAFLALGGREWFEGFPIFLWFIPPLYSLCGILVYYYQGLRGEEGDSGQPDSNREALAQRYESIQNRLFIADIVLTIGAVVAFFLLGGSTNLRNWVLGFTANPYLVPLLYAAVVTLVYYFVLLIPLDAIGYHFEHRFRLSNQSFPAWLEDKFKSLLLNMVLMMLFLEVTYFLLRVAGTSWWIWAAGFWTLFGVLMANLMPVLILPMFYKLKPLEDESLRERLKGLAQRVHIKVVDIYEMDLSRKTRKANAMLAGLGNTKRIILGDTILKKYTSDEIETIIAHELGHHYRKHIPKSMAFGTIMAFVGFFAASQLLSAAVEWFAHLGITGIADIAGFPLIMMTIFVFGLATMPISNAFSRYLEREADHFALRLTDRPTEFISAMKKLAEQNLADKEPSAVVEFLLHDHPSISRRIEAAEEYSLSKRA